MSDEEYKNIRITRDDLIDWIDRPPSNSDIELCDYLVNALDNQYKYYNEIQQLKEVIDEVRTGMTTLIHRTRFEEDFCEEDIELEKLLQILDKAKEVTKR